MMRSMVDISKKNLANNLLNCMSFCKISSWNLCYKLDRQEVLSRNARLDLDKLQVHLVYRRVHTYVGIFLMQYRSIADLCTNCHRCSNVDKHHPLLLLKKRSRKTLLACKDLSKCWKQIYHLNNQTASFYNKMRNDSHIREVRGFLRQRFHRID